MMKTLPVLLALGFFTPLAWAQEHAPLAAQCQADVALWNDKDKQLEYEKAEKAKAQYDTPNRTEINKLSFRELSQRVVEMGECESVDPPRFEDYYQTMTFYSEVVSDRFRSFVHRHHLFEQLIREDAEGQR
jgi:hypothetical protein